MPKGSEGERLLEYKRNQSLENLLDEVNRDLWKVEQESLTGGEPKYPIIFIVGPHRSGSTLMMQWLANLGLFAYPTNLLSRFYRAPIMGAKLQLLLADERYNFRNELKDFSNEVDFLSENGKTKGALAPNEFWYFWRRFLPFSDFDYLPTEELLKVSDTKTMVAEFAGMMDVFKKPMALKAMILNYNIDFLNQLFEKAIFIHIKRDPLTNIASALEARERQLGSIDKWYSFKIPEYDELKKLSPYEQVAGQVFYINKAVEKGLAGVAEHKKMAVEYEEFCSEPNQVYEQLCGKLALNKFRVECKYNSKEKFKMTREKVTDKNILDAFRLFS